MMLMYQMSYIPKKTLKIFFEKSHENIEEDNNFECEKVDEVKDNQSNF